MESLTLNFRVSGNLVDSESEDVTMDSGNEASDRNGEDNSDDKSESDYADGEESSSDDNEDLGPDSDFEIIPNATYVPGPPLPDISSSLKVHAITKKTTFDGIIEQKYKLLYRQDPNDPQLVSESLEAMNYRYKCELVELEEMKENLEAQIMGTREAMDEISAEIYLNQAAIHENLQRLGISSALYQEYEAFCESLEPDATKFRIYEGYSALCHGSHYGDYVRYDPTFQVLKDCVETDYTLCHIRCEARTNNSEPIVEFWTLNIPHLSNDSVVLTWGNAYPRLYTLLIAAIREGSAAAQEMFIKLPNMDSSCNGGWLLDYKSEPALRHHPVLSRRWRFRSAHCIDHPETKDEKLSRLATQVNLLCHE